MDPSGSATFAELAAQLAEIGRYCYARGWALGTSGNFSAVVRRNPMRLAITASGVDKDVLSVGQVVEIDQDGKVVGGSGAPSAEASLHLTIARARSSGADSPRPRARPTRPRPCRPGRSPRPGPPRGRPYPRRWP